MRLFNYRFFFLLLSGIPDSLLCLLDKVFSFVRACLETLKSFFRTESTSANPSRKYDQP